MQGERENLGDTADVTFEKLNEVPPGATVHYRPWQGCEGGNHG
jgi:hypothetical protein